MSKMTPAAFRAWRRRMGWSQQAAANALGISRRTVINYEQGKPEPSRVVGLACAALALGITDYTGHKDGPGSTA